MEADAVLRRDGCSTHDGRIGQPRRTRSRSPSFNHLVAPWTRAKRPSHGLCQSPTPDNCGRVSHPARTCPDRLRAGMFRQENPLTATEIQVVRPAGNRAWGIVFRVLFRTTPKSLMLLLAKAAPSVPFVEVVVVGRRTGT